MSTTNQNLETRQSVLLAWRALLEKAQDKPWLAGLLARRGTQIFNRFVNFYHYLCGLPRRLRRALDAQLRRLATTLLGAALLLALSPAQSVHAASIMVDGTLCTLEEAITTANDGSAQDGCVNGDASGPDTIALQTEVTLSSSLPVITTPLTIEGNGYTINANGVGSVLSIDNAAVTIKDANITGGDANNGGGGIRMTGTSDVTINNSTVSGNTAEWGGGIYNYYGTLTLNNSIVSGNSASGGGGAIYNGNTLIVNNSTISGNTSAYNGGAIYSGNAATLNNSTISGNSATSLGGAIITFSNLTLNNTTISANEAGGGGGFYNYGGATVTLNRSIVSGNTATEDGDEIYSAGTVTADNHNVIGYGGSERSYGFTRIGSDIVPPGALNTVLDTTLYDNGGPTLTHALVSGSDAIDVAPDADCNTSPIDGYDQRAAPRNVDGDSSPSSNECDAGAFEYGGTPTAIALSSITAQAASGGGLPAGLAALALGACTAGYKLWIRTMARTRRAVTERLS